jgi:hypothetical protein
MTERKVLCMWCMIPKPLDAFRLNSRGRPDRYCDECAPKVKASSRRHQASVRRALAPRKKKSSPMSIVQGGRTESNSRRH